MSRKIKFLLFISFIILSISLLSVVVNAEDEYFTISYYKEDTLKESNTYLKGTVITLRDTRYTTNHNDWTFFGWFTRDGDLYDPGQEITVEKDLMLYEAIGVNAENETDLRNYFCGQSFCYVRLQKDLTLTSSLSTPWGVGILDLNGYNISITADNYAVGGVRTGVILLGSGKITYSTSRTDTAGFYHAEGHGYGDGGQRLWIGKNVIIDCRVPLVKIAKDMTWLVGMPNVYIYGDVTCTRLMVSQGTRNIDFNIYDTAKINIMGAKSLFEDANITEDITLANVNIYGGTFTFPGLFTGFFAEGENRYRFTLNGGTFNMDISKYISTDYLVQSNGDGTYSVEPNLCPVSENKHHKYLATEINVTCEEDGTIVYECEYCGDQYTSQRFALGHSYVAKQTAYIVNTKYETKPGEYLYYCARCNKSYTEYYFPDPTTVYVSVTFRKDGVEETFRIKSSDIFGFTGTVVNSITLVSYKHKYDDGTEKTFTLNDIVELEFPLGATKVAKNSMGNTLRKNLEIVHLPQSIETVESTSFAFMPSLRTVTGIEYVSKTIETSAFEQDTDSKLEFDTLILSAKNINTAAFKNCLAKRIIFKSTVETVRDAFQLGYSRGVYEQQYDNGNGFLKEIFIEKFTEDKYPDMNGTVFSSFPSSVKSELFKQITISTLLTRAPVYYDHHYVDRVVEPNCISQGYSTHICEYCGLETRYDFVSNEGITHEWVEGEEYNKASTCMEKGYIARYCPKCNTIDVIQYLDYDPDAHTYSNISPGPQACTSSDWYYYYRCACGKFGKSTGKPGDGTIIGHSWLKVEEVEPTCSENGHLTTKCENCNEEIVEEYPATGEHNYIVKDDSKSYEPTCASEGRNYFRCITCSDTIYKTVKKLSYEEAVIKNKHKWVENIIVEPTEEKEGQKKYICSLCANPKNKGTPQELIIIPKLSSGMPGWLIGTIIGGSVLAAGGAGVTVYFTFFKKKAPSTKYKYNFNTFKKK